MIGTPKMPGGARIIVWLWTVAIIAAIGTVGYQAIHYDFVSWDDELNITLNPHLGPPARHTLHWMFTDVAYMRRYVPFGWLGFSIAYAGSGLSPVAYHLGCVLLHILNGGLLFLAIRWMLSRLCPQIEPARAARCAGIGALFWAIHPLRAETIGWSSGMLYSLSCAWGLLSVLSYCRAHSSAGLAASRTWRWTAAALYSISMLTYPITLGLIAVFAGIDALEVRRRGLAGESKAPVWRNLLLQKIPFAAAALGAAAITLYGRFTAHELWTHVPSLDEYGLSVRIMRGLHSTVWFLRETVWPANLTPLPTQLASFRPFGVGAIASTVLLGGITWWLWRRPRQTGFVAWVVFLVVLSPLLGFTEKEFYLSNRYTYLPGMIGGLAVATLLAAVPAQRHAAASIAAGILLAALGIACHQQLRIWENSATLFARSVALSKDQRLTESTFRRWIDFHGSRREITAAKDVLARALDSGVRPSARNEMVVAVARLEQEKAAGLPPLLARVHADLGLSLVRQQRPREANEHFAAALRIAPGFTKARYNQALLTAESGDPRQATRLLETAMAANDGSVSPEAERQGWALLAQAFTQRGEMELAEEAQRRANKAPSKSP